MINRVCSYIHNHFTADKQGNPYRRWSGEFSISDGGMELPLLDGQYYVITGSKLNDGMHKYPSDDLMDETFTGIVYECVVPREVLGIIADIEEWEAKNADAISSPYQSESFGGYSYTKASAGNNSGAVGNGMNWESVFGYRLTPWKRLYNGR